MIITVSGAGGRMGSLVAQTVANAAEFELGPLYDPRAAGSVIAGETVGDDPIALAGSDVVVEFTEPDVVMENLGTWRDLRIDAVVGTSGFDAVRIATLRSQWGSGPPNCLVVPNFSIGAVVMMRLSEIAAPHFAAAEVIELHHDRKVDAPSGTAIATAERIANSADQQQGRRLGRTHPGRPRSGHVRYPRPRCATAWSCRSSARPVRRRRRDTDDPTRHDRPNGVHAGSPRGNPGRRRA